MVETTPFLPRHIKVIWRNGEDTACVARRLRSIPHRGTTKGARGVSKVEVEDRLQIDVR